jgi:hypothetical protein
MVLVYVFGSAAISTDAHYFCQFPETYRFADIALPCGCGFQILIG